MNDITNIDIIKMYTETDDEVKALIHQTDKKAKKALRITVWLKIIVSLVFVSAIASWLKYHGHKEIWAFLLIFSQLADMLLDNLPYFNQRINLPQMKIKLEHIEIELKSDLLQFERGIIDEDEAVRRYFANRKAWLKAAG